MNDSPVRDIVIPMFVPTSYSGFLLFDYAFTLTLAIYFLVCYCVRGLGCIGKVFLCIRIVLIFFKNFEWSIGFTLFFALDRTQINPPLFILSVIYYGIYFFLTFRLLAGLCQLLGG